LDARGNVWVADFGLAKASEGEDLTDTGDVVGTLRYLAPERLRGQSDARSDIYSLGLTLYELLTLRPAFDATDREWLIQQVTHGDPPPPRRLDARVPRDIETIVLKAITREPARRYGTAAALAEDLQRYLEDRPIRARRVSVAERLWRWCRRNPWIAGLSALTAALFLLATLVSSVLAIREFQAQEDLEENLYFSRISQAAREQEARNSSRAWEVIEECPPRLRGWEWYYLQRSFLEPPMEFRSQVGRFAGIAFSPLGDRLATVSLDLGSKKNNAVVEVWDATSGSRLWHRRVTGSVVREGHRVALCYSSDGQRLAAPDLDPGGSRTCAIMVWDAATGRVVHRLEGHDALVVGLGFSKDGATIASAGSDGSVRLWDAVSGRESPPFFSSVHSTFSMAFRNDGLRVALGGEDGTVSLWDVSSGKRLHDLGQLRGRIDCIAFDSDAKHLVAGSANGDVKIWAATSGRELSELPRLPATVFGLTFNSVAAMPRLAMGSGDGMIRLWDLRSSKEALSIRVRSGLYGMAFSPEGSRLALAFGDGSIRILSGAPIESSAASEPAVQIRGNDSIYSAVYSPDGERLATIESVQGPIGPFQVLLRDATTGRTLANLGLTSSESRSVSFDSGGKSIVMLDQNGEVVLKDLLKDEGQRLSGKMKGDMLTTSPDGGWIATSHQGEGQASQVVIWDASRGDVKCRLDAGNSNLPDLAFRPDGRRIAAISVDLHLRAWDMETGGLKYCIRAHTAWAGSLAFSPDGKQIATGGIGENELKIWDSETGALVRALPGHLGCVLDLEFCPDGRWLASCGSDKTVRIWDVKTGQEIRTLFGHKDWLSSISFRPDGKRLASTGRDRTIKIWDVRPSSPAYVRTQ
jgi:WD40 repeat protein